MRLITHNVMRCNIKGVKDGFPMQIDAKEVKIIESPFREDYMREIVSNIEWFALRKAIEQVGLPKAMLPEDISSEMLNDIEFLRALQRLIMDVRIIEGSLICPESGRKFPISDGIVNMMLSEDECARDDK